MLSSADAILKLLAQFWNKTPPFSFCAASCSLCSQILACWAPGAQIPSLITLYPSSQWVMASLASEMGNNLLATTLSSPGWSMTLWMPGLQLYTLSILFVSKDTVEAVHPYGWKGLPGGSSFPPRAVTSIL